jgi:hypothetical protein
MMNITAEMTRTGHLLINYFQAGGKGAWEIGIVRLKQRHPGTVEYPPPKGNLRLTIDDLRTWITAVVREMIEPCEDNQIKPLNGHGYK